MACSCWQRRHGVIGQICNTLQGPVHLHMYDTLSQGELNEARITQKAVDACLLT
jgi:hypothetical protein